MWCVVENGRDIYITSSLPVIERLPLWRWRSWFGCDIYVTRYTEGGHLHYTTLHDTTRHDTACTCDRATSSVAMTKLIWLWYICYEIYRGGSSTLYTTRHDTTRHDTILTCDRATSSVAMTKLIWLWLVMGFCNTLLIDTPADSAASHTKQTYVPSQSNQASQIKCHNHPVKSSQSPITEMMFHTKQSYPAKCQYKNAKEIRETIVRIKWSRVE